MRFLRSESEVCHGHAVSIARCFVMTHLLLLWGAVLIGILVLITCCVVVLPSIEDTHQASRRKQP